MVLTPSGDVSVCPGGQLTILQLQHELELYRMEWSQFLNQENLDLTPEDSLQLSHL